MRAARKTARAQTGKPKSSSARAAKQHKTRIENEQKRVWAAALVVHKASIR